MPDIRYVCLSDMHFGEEDSLLTNLKTASFDPDPFQASPVLQQLVACLRDLIGKNEGGPKPTLILNGDILELATAARRLGGSPEPTVAQPSRPRSRRGTNSD